MSHLGDFDASTVVYGKFTTYRPSTGAAFTLGGTPALSVYKDNSTTQSTTGVTLTADFDTVTGLNHFAIDTSADGTFYAAGSFFDIVITTGTVDSVSVVGSVVGSFTLRKNSALKPTTAARTLDVTATGAAGIDWGNVENPTTAVNLSATNIDTDQVVASVSGAVGSVTGAVGSVTGNVGGSVASVTAVSSGAITEASFATTAGSFAPLGIIDQGTAQSATGTTLVLRAAAAFADDEIIGATIVITGGTTGVGQRRVITDYVSATDTATVDTWTTTPSGTITYKIFGTAPAATDAAGIRAAVGLASANLDTQLADLPTTAEFEARTLVAASYATATALDTVDNFLDTEIAAILAAVDTEVAAIKAKTDSLTFTTAGMVDAAIKRVGDTTLTTGGTGGQGYGAA